MAGQESGLDGKDGQKERCGARDWGRGKGEQHTTAIEEVPRLTILRTVSKIWNLDAENEVDLAHPGVAKKVRVLESSTCDREYERYKI